MDRFIIKSIFDNFRIIKEKYYMDENEKPTTSVVPYLPSANAQRSDDPVALVNEFSEGYVNKMTTNASKISNAVGITAVSSQLGLSKYSNEWTQDTTKNLLSAIAIIMLLNKFKTDGIPFIKANWKPVGAGALVIAYLLFKAKEAEAEQKRIASLPTVVIPTVRG
jgi:hypothetical protein